MKDDQDRKTIEGVYAADFGYPKKFIQDLKSGVPGAGVIELPGANHYVFLSRQTCCVKYERSWKFGSEQNLHGEPNMSDETPNPQINISKIPMGSGVGGAFAAFACILIILLGLPELWYFLPGSIALGCIVALALHFIHHKNPGEPWILPTMKK